MRVTVAILGVALGAQRSIAAVYDRAITVFSPDGKLMQVSYAEQAVQRGSLAVAASNGRDAIVMCIERPARDEPAAEGHGDVAEAAFNTVDAGRGAESVEAGEAVELGGRKRGSDVMDRRRRRGRRDGGGVLTGTGVGVVDEANNQDRKLCEVDDGVYLAFAGISADGRVLASKIRLECQNYRYGMGVAPGVGYVARYVGGLQHRYTRTGGARPFGVSCLVVGFDEDTTRPIIFRSEPSGAFAEWTASAVGKASEKALGKLEAVSDLSALNWRGTADAAVKATLAGGATECDVLVLRCQAPQVATTDTSAAEDADNEDGLTSSADTLGVAGGGWRRRGGAWTQRFVGSIRGDGRVELDVARGVEVAGGGEERDVLVL